MYTRVKTRNLFRAVEAALFKVLLPTLFIVVNNINPQSGITMPNNIVDSNDNVGSTTLNNAVFNYPEQFVRFLLYTLNIFHWSG